MYDSSYSFLSAASLADGKHGCLLPASWGARGARLCAYFKEKDCRLALDDEDWSHLLYPPWTTREMYRYLVPVSQSCWNYSNGLNMLRERARSNTEVRTCTARHDSEEGHATWGIRFEGGLAPICPLWRVVIVISKPEVWVTQIIAALPALPVLLRSSANVDGAFASAGKTNFNGNEQECLAIHYSQFCHHKNNQRRQKQVSAIAQQVLIMGWQVFVPRWRPAGSISDIHGYAGLIMNNRKRQPLHSAERVWVAVYLFCKTGPDENKHPCVFQVKIPTAFSSAISTIRDSIQI